MRRVLITSRMTEDKTSLTDSIVLMRSDRKIEDAKKNVS